jgi:hypothetical protein
MEKSNMDQFIQNHAANVQRWERNRMSAADKTYAAQERAQRLADVGARVRDGSYPDTGVPLTATVASPKLRDDLAKGAANADTRDTRNDRTGEDNEPFQSDFTVQNY